MVETLKIKNVCPICCNKLLKKDRIHYSCNDCNIIWHLEDLNGKIEKIKKLLKTPKDKNSISYIKLDRNAYTLLYSSVWYIWGIRGTQDKEENKKTDILLIHKKSNIEFEVKNWKRCQRISGSTKHIWHYIIYSNNELIFDGEYEGENARKGHQSNLISHVINILNEKICKI